MLEGSDFIILLMGMMSVTVFSRLVPTLLVANFAPGPRMELWLKQVPAAVMAAIVLPALVVQDSDFDVSFDNPACWVGLATIAIAVTSKNLYLTILFGMGLMIGVQLVL